MWKEIQAYLISLKTAVLGTLVTSQSSTTEEQVPTRNQMQLPQTFRQTIKSYKLVGEINQCPSCNLYFNSNTAFSFHRTGPHSSRKCLTEEEMSAKGMVLSARDLWCKEAASDRLRKHIDEHNRGETPHI